MFDAHSENNVLSLLKPAARTANANGAGIDVREYIGIGKAVLDSAAGGGTSPTMDVKLQESDDNSTFTDIAGATFTQVVGAAALEGIKVDLDSAKRYIRAAVTIGGTSPTFTCNATLIGRKQTV